MSYADDIEELIRDEPPEVKAALRRALSLLENDDGPSPEESVKTLVKLGALAAGGAVPGGALIVEGVVALLTLGRTIRKKRLQKVAASRRQHTAAGLAARRASRATSARENAKKAAAAWEKSRVAASKGGT